MACHPYKCIGPSSCLVVLGIELDSVAQVACLPADKFHAIQELIQACSGRRWCSRHQLGSLIGLLHHAARGDLTGSYLSAQHDCTSMLFSQYLWPSDLCHFWVDQLDLQWWHQFLSWLFPGMSATPDLEVTADASGSVGFGTKFMKGVNVVWWILHPSQASQSIAFKELFHIVIGAHVWGFNWSRSSTFMVWQLICGGCLEFKNLQDSLFCSVTSSLQLLILTFLLLPFMFLEFSIYNIAHALSHFNWQEFRRLTPQVQSLPVATPPQLLAELIKPS